MACDATWDRMTFDGAGSADVMCDELSYGSVIHHVVGISHSVPWWEEGREGRRHNRCCHTSSKLSKVNTTGGGEEVH